MKMPKTESTGWERERRTHFDEIIVNYDRIRPDYPTTLFEDIIKYTGFKFGIQAIEIGAGTGKATASFLKAGYKVTAVEIGANMADFLLNRFNGCNGLNVVIDSFENASLDENSFDLIYAASAFHWVDAKIGCPKAFRLLKNGGVIALFRYNEMSAHEENLNKEIKGLYEKYYYTHYTSKHWHPQRKTKAELEKPSRIFVDFGFESLQQYGFVDVSMKFYDFTRSYNADEYIMWLDTMADCRGLPETNKTALYAKIKEAILNNGGKYTLDYVFQLYMGRKPS
jgi:SAM-dependent methyltransferase